MIRILAIAALVASVLATPSHQALAQNTLGGAIVGGVGGAIVGGAIGGRRGAAIGAVIGAGTGAAIASEGERRRGGYYYYRDRCYWPEPDGSYVPVDPRYWSPGRTLQGTALLALDTRGPRRAEHAALDLRGGSPDYERVSIEARERLDLLPRGDGHLSWRLYAGSAFDRPPRELLFDAAEGSRVDSLGRFYLNDRGPLLASGHYWMEGGGGLRGYRGRAILGRRLWGLNADLELPMLPVALFGDVGDLETTRTLADAGLGFDMGPLRLTAPLWVGRPEPGKDPWQVRWLLSLESVPISF